VDIDALYGSSVIVQTFGICSSDIIPTLPCRREERRLDVVENGTASGEGVDDTSSAQFCTENKVLLFSFMLSQLSQLTH
jgi:hypothetical protein